jgi:3-oxoacyl-[acyl-carrier protein] reductase
MKGLKDKIVVITGAAGGIGRATAERFYNEGAKLILVDIPALKETELAQQFPERMQYIEADVSKESDLRKIEASLQAGVDILVNNAGITRDSSTLKMTDEQWDEVIAVNLTAVFKLSRMAAQAMKNAGRGGVILNAASVVAHYGNFGQANYVATKAGVIGMTKTMAREFGKLGIRVNAVAPGFIGTAMVKKMPENILKMMAEKTPIGRVGEPSEIASAYAFLASDDARFISGTCLNVDGGLVIG